MNRTPTAAVVIAGLLAIALLSGCEVTQNAAAAAASPRTRAVGGAAGDGTYVALGDSYTAAPLLAGQGSSPAGCLRSADDYPAIVAGALHSRAFTNVSCYGASTHLTRGTDAPERGRRAGHRQADPRRPRTRLDPLTG